MIRTCLFLFSLFCSVLASNGQAVKPPTHKSSAAPSILQKKIRASYRGATLEYVLDDLSRRYNISFSYVSEMIPLDSKIYASVKNQTLETLLFHIFRRYPVSFIGLEDQVVLMKKTYADNLAAGENADSVKIINIKSRSVLVSGDLKISVRDLLRGDLKSPFDEQIQVRINARDSMMVDQRYIDSLQEVSHRLRRARVKLIRGKEFNPKFGVEIMVRGELAHWSIYGSFDQSIDYSRFNDYHKPDLSYSETVSLRYRFFREFYVQPGIGSANIIRKGTHTDYLISLFNPTRPQAVRYSFSSNYNYLSLTFEAGAGLKFSKLKILGGIGYWQGILIGREAPEYLPFFEPKYYVSGPPYMNSRLQRLRQERVQYKMFFPGVYGNVKLQISLSRYMEMVTELQYRYHYSSIYSGEASVIERVYLWGAGIGVKVNLL